MVVMVLQMLCAATSAPKAVLVTLAAHLTAMKHHRMHWHAAGRCGRPITAQ